MNKPCDPDKNQVCPAFAYSTALAPGRSADAGRSLQGSIRVVLEGVEEGKTIDDLELQKVLSAAGQIKIINEHPHNPGSICTLPPTSALVRATDARQLCARRFPQAQARRVLRQPSASVVRRPSRILR